MLCHDCSRTVSTSGPAHLAGPACRQARQQSLQTLWYSAHRQRMPPGHRHQAGHGPIGLEGRRGPGGGRPGIQYRSQRAVVLEGRGGRSWPFRGLSSLHLNFIHQHTCIKYHGRVPCQMGGGLVSGVGGGCCPHLWSCQQRNCATQMCRLVVQTCSLPTLTGMSLLVQDPVLQGTYMAKQPGKQGIDLSQRLQLWPCKAAAVP